MEASARPTRRFVDRSLDALRFLKRGASLVNAVVLIQEDDGRSLLSGLRITSNLVLTLRTGTHTPSAKLAIDGVITEVAWANSNGMALLLRTARYEGPLADLAMAPYEGAASILWCNPAGDPRLAFGHAQAHATHDLPTKRGATGGPLFDDAWRLIGLHIGRTAQHTRTYVPIAQLAREFEESPCWQEIADTHRLVRTVAAEAAAQAQSEPEPARAVRW